MKIKVGFDGTCGDVDIPRGDYLVSLNAGVGEMCLVGGGRTLNVKAVRRRMETKSKVTQIQFFSGGGQTWSLVISAPKLGEWVAFIEKSNEI